MSYGKIVRNSHSRVEQSLMSLYHGMPAGPMGPPPQFLEHIVVLCFERRYAEQNSVNSFHPPNLLVPPNFWTGYATGFIERLLRVAQRYLGAACDFQKNGFNLLVVEHLK